MPWTQDQVTKRGEYAMRHTTTQRRFPGDHELEEGYKVPAWMERGTEPGVDPDTGESLSCVATRQGEGIQVSGLTYADDAQPIPAAPAAPVDEMDEDTDMASWNDPLPKGDPEA